MTAIITVGGNGIIDEDYSLFDQYANTLNNVLGITDTAQDALGRLVIPHAAVPPTSPTQGRLYYDTALLTARLFDGSLWQNLSGIAQIVSSAHFNAAVSSPGGTPLTGATVNITTHGGRLLIMVVTTAGDTWFMQYSGAAQSNYIQVGSQVGLAIDGTDIGAYQNAGFYAANAPASGPNLGSTLSQFQIPSNLTWWREAGELSAGAHVIQLLGNPFGSGAAMSLAGKLVVIEFN